MDINQELLAVLKNLEQSIKSNQEATAGLAAKVEAVVAKAAENKPTQPAAPNLDAKQIQEMVDAEVNKRIADLKRSASGNLIHPTGGALSLEKLFPLRESLGKVAAVQALTSNADIVELQKRHDAFYTFKQLMQVVAGWTPAQVMESKWGKQLFDGYQEVVKSVYTTATNAGDEWVYPGFSAQVLSRVDMANKLWSIFPSMQIPMGVEDWTIPLMTTRGKMYLQGQATRDDAARYLSSTPGTDKLTLSVKTFAARYLFSQEMTEDSAIAIMQWLQNDMVDVFARGRDEAVLNGDTSAVHMDSDVTVSIDHRKGYKGLRKIASDLGGLNFVDLGSVTNLETSLMELRKGLGKLGENPADLVYIISLRMLIKMMSFEGFKTVDKYGAGATVLTGELGRFYGVPVVLSAFQRDDCNASGVYDGVTKTKTGVTLVYPKGFVTTNKRQLRIESAPDILVGQTNVVGTERVGFARIRTLADETPVVHGYNITA
jgi:HK97 family phage major capsid protein